MEVALRPCDHVSHLDGAATSMLDDQVLFGIFAAAEKLNSHSCEHGAIEGAEVAALVPQIWNGNVLVYAHGHRPVGLPRLAELEELLASDGHFAALLQAGWILGMTSYRREGRIIRDAMRDVVNLLRFLDQFTRGQKPQRVVLEGRSMGGGICTRLAERAILEQCLAGEVGCGIDGVLAIGAALGTQDEPEFGGEAPFSFCPEVPILFLTNVSETGPIRSYIESVRTSGCPDAILPALWEVYREGHNWTNAAERGKALANLVMWIDHKTFITRKTWQVTLPCGPRPSQVEVMHWQPGVQRGSTPKAPDRPLRMRAKVTQTSVHNSFFTSLQLHDLQALGVSVAKRFCIWIEGTCIEEAVLSVHPHVGIAHGALLAIECPEGWIMFCRNTYKASNLLRDLGLTLGSCFEVSAPVPPARRAVAIPCALEDNSESQQT